MRPLKFSEIVAAAAEQSGEPLKVVETLLGVYFKELRTALTSLPHLRIQVLNLGTFSVKPYTLKKRLERRQELLGRLGGEPVGRQVIQQQVKEEINQIGNVLRILHEERMRKGKLKEFKRCIHESSNKPDNDMEKER